MSTKNAKVAQGEATLRHLIQTARDMFSRDGYGNVSTTEIVKVAGVTRGALYHHFDSKDALFRAVLEDVQADIGAQIMQAADAEADDWQKLLKGCEAFFRASLDPAFQQVVMLDAPGVLGREVWREIDDEATTQLLLEQLDDLAAQGIIQVESTRILAHMLAGAMNEAVLFIAGEASQEEALGAVMRTLTMLLETLRSHD